MKTIQTFKMMSLALMALVCLAAELQAASPESSAVPQAIDINRATVEQLAELPYMGMKKAELIVARRNEKAFTSVDELLEIKGIGEKTLAKLRPHVRVGAPAPKSP